MRKKVVSLFLGAMLIVLSAFAFTACSAKSSGKGLTYNKKYIHESDVKEVEAEQTYFVFHKNNTGEYHYFFKYVNVNNKPEVTSYTITFKFTTAENNMVHCFYDSVNYDDVHNQKKDEARWTYTLYFSKDVLAYEGQTVTEYICEDYLKEIPNFG